MAVIGSELRTPKIITRLASRDVVSSRKLNLGLFLDRMAVGMGINSSAPVLTPSPFGVKKALHLSLTEIYVEFPVDKITFWQPPPPFFFLKIRCERQKMCCVYSGVRAVI